MASAEGTTTRLRIPWRAASAPQEPRIARHPDRRPLRAWAAAIAVVAAIALSAAACGGTSGDSGATAKVQGLQRAQPLLVGSVILPEVEPGVPAKPFAMKARTGGLLFVYFGYTNCPDLCPTTLADLRKALQQVGPPGADRVDVAFATVDPERDTPEVLVGYVRSFVPRAHALRTEDSAELARAEEPFLASSTVRKKANGESEVSHTAVSYVVDPDGRVVVEWAFGTSPEAMANDLRILLAPAPSGGDQARAAAGRGRVEAPQPHPEALP